MTTRLSDILMRTSANESAAKNPEQSETSNKLKILFNFIPHYPISEFSCEFSEYRFIHRHRNNTIADGRCHENQKHTYSLYYSVIKNTANTLPLANTFRMTVFILCNLQFSCNFLCLFGEIDEETCIISTTSLVHLSSA